MLNLNSTATGNSEVTVTDIKMPFWSMVGFMVKLAFASIPAIIIINIIVGLVVIGLIAGASALGVGLSALSAR